MKMTVGFLVLAGLWLPHCNQGPVSGPPQNQGGGAGQMQSADVQSQTVEELEADLFKAACDEDMKQNFKEQIESQKSLLTDQELKNSLRNMKEDIKC